jgi:uncharacterized membrane protein
MISTGRAFDRLVNFTDAIVAVAITVLVLSIVDIRATSADQSVWQLINEHSSEIVTFLFTFVVVAAMWRVHNRIFDGMRGYDSPIFWLNLLWLCGIVFLPWPSALYGEGTGVGPGGSGGSDLSGAALLYWGTLAVISFSGGLISLRVQSHPELIDPKYANEAHTPTRGFVFAAMFLVIGIVSVFAPSVAAWLPLALIPAGIMIRRWERRRPTSDSVTA